MADGPAPELLAGPADLRAAVTGVARRIGADHPDGVTLVGLLKASTIFLADLVRELRVPTRVEFLALAPYDGETSRTRVVKDLDRSVRGEALVLVTAVVDTGFSVDFTTRHLAGLEPASLRVATLADKPARRILPVEPRYAALTAPDRFLLGYGLAYRGRYRNLPGLWAVEAADLVDDPGHHVGALYPR